MTHFSHGGAQNDHWISDATNQVSGVTTAGFISFVVAELVSHFGVLSLLGAWLSSMRTSLPSGKHRAASIAVKVAYVLFVKVAIAEIALYLLSFSMDKPIYWSTYVYIFSGVVQALLLAIIVWLLAGLTESIVMPRSKKKQLYILVALVLVSPTFFPIWYYLGIVIWFLRCVIIVWPGALVGFDKAPDTGYHYEHDAAKV